MRKITYTIIILILSISIVNAKPCFIVSGTGKNIGDEIACGTEHFYVVSNDGTNVKMLGKYNLLVDSKYDNFYLEEQEYEKEDHIYKNQKVIDRINDTGILLGEKRDFRDYEYDSVTKKYTIYSISGIADMDETYKIVTLDGVLRTYEQMMNTPEIKSMLEDGWKIYDEYYDSTPTINGNKHYSFYAIALYKNENVDKKTIFLDGTSRNLKDLYNLPEIKTLLEQGYQQDSLYSNTTSIQNNENYGTYYAITLSKYNYIDTMNIIFEEKIVGSTNLKNYIDNNKLIQEKIAEGYSYNRYIYSEYVSNIRNYNFYGIMLEKENEISKKTLQNEKAIGINGDVNGPNYPFYGVVYRNNELSELRKNTYGEVYGGEYYQDFNIDSFSYLADYKKTLQEMGYPVTNVSTLSVKELNEITKTLTGKEIPLENWYENGKVISDESYQTHIVLGNLKELYNGEHSWIWNTSYWLKTVNVEEDYYTKEIYNINTMGDLCLTSHCAQTASRGLRPLVTIEAKNIVYKIYTKSDGNGTVEADFVEAAGGTVVKFTIEPKEGYVLGAVKVTDAEGNVVVFTDYTFTMPNADVTIEAIFEPSNPETSDIAILLCIIVTAIAAFVIINNIKKKNYI